MHNPLKKMLVPLKETQNIRGIDLPIGLEFLQLVVTGPPGAGKSYYIDQIGGWPNEGYIDLTRKGWWKEQSLTFRPREVHLGLPFIGHKESITVFDKEWLDSETRPELDPGRIVLPPINDGFLSAKWRERYIFEFLIPPSNTIFAQRTGRQEEGYFPVDDDLTLEMVKKQLNIYREVALYLHRAGMSVYVREGLGAPPMIIMETGFPNVPLWSVEKKIEAPSLKTIDGWRWLLFRSKPINWLELSHEQQSIKKSSRVAHNGRGFELKLGQQSLYCQPEMPLGVPKKHIEKNWTISPTFHCSAPNSPAFCRLKVGETMVLGRSNTFLTDIVQLDKSVASRHLSISNIKGDIVITPLDKTATTSAALLSDLDHREKLSNNRYASFMAIRKLMDGSVQAFQPKDALATLLDVTELLDNEENRPLDRDGQPGAIIEIDSSIHTIIIGDLHAQVDNFLKILTENCIIGNLRTNKTQLIILGDAIHSEIAGEMEDMETSLLLFDIILRLKLKFPNNIHYLRGNHDSFSAEISKNGILQGILFKDYITEHRGESYVEAIHTFWHRIPYIAISPLFCACHGGPPIKEYTREDLININHKSKIQKEILTNRVERPGSMTGYYKNDVKRFREILGLPNDTSLIVGHTPLDPFASVWTNAGAIKNHHILYSAHNQGPSIFTQARDKMVSVAYPYEPLTKLINKI